jgi:DNA polymerase-3 subunit epsilon
VREFCGREPSEAHRASGDVQDVYDVLLGQFDRWKDLPRNVEKLSELCFPPDPDRLDDTGKFRWQNGKVILTFGKNAGKAIEVLPKDYLQWICGADFSEEVKQIAREAMQGRYPKRN